MGYSVREADGNLAPSYFIFPDLLHQWKDEKDEIFLKCIANVKRLQKYLSKLEVTNG